jgi:hypothetical protein
MDNILESMKDHASFGHLLRLYIVANLLQNKLDRDSYQRISSQYPGVLDSWFGTFIQERLKY